MRSLQYATCLNCYSTATIETVQCQKGTTVHGLVLLKILVQGAETAEILRSVALTPTPPRQIASNMRSNKDVVCRV